MNVKRAAMVGIWAITVTATGQEVAPSADAEVRAKPLEWNDPKWWDLMAPKSTGLKVGRSDFVVDGLVIAPFRPSRGTERRSLRQRFFSMPFVSPISPKSSTQSPVRRTDYFAWGEGNVAWSVLSDRPIPGPQSAILTVAR